MAEHRSLDAFGTGESRDERSQPGTYRWVPDGAECFVCGEEATRFWRDDHGLVCPDCKDW